MNRLADVIVPLGFRIACRRATWPTRRSPWSVKATTDGVVRAPSALGITVGCPPSTVAITELVVPRSIPTAFATVLILRVAHVSPPYRRGSTPRRWPTSHDRVVRGGFQPSGPVNAGRRTGRVGRRERSRRHDTDRAGG